MTGARTPKGQSPLKGFTNTLAPYAFFVLLGYCIADVALLSVRQFMVPMQAPPQKPSKFKNEQGTSRSSYSTIVSRNIFNSEGIIPDPLAAKNEAGSQSGGEIPPVPSQLPLGLMGTIVHSNPAKSIANIEVRSKNQVIAFVPNRDIDSIATLVRVERNRAVIRNGNNGRLEYIEIKSNSKVSFNGGKTGIPLAGPVGNLVKAVGTNKFEVNRTDLLKYTSDMSNLLMQASTRPRTKPSGEVECYILTSFQPNSVFSQLSLQTGDCIKSVNGEPIDSPAKALELYSALKNSSTIKLGYERDGQTVENDYMIK